VRRAAALSLVSFALAAPEAHAAPVPAPTRYAPIVVGDRAIDVVTLMHWQRVAAISKERRGHTHWHTSAVRRQVAQLLISYAWIELEAARRAIVVTDAETLASFREQRRFVFPRGGFARFLHDSGQTRADVLFRVRLDLLSERIHRQLVAGVPKSQRDAALARFATEFQAHWRPLTVCRPQYTVEECGAVVRG
jgi:hypothetical protein